MDFFEKKIDFFLKKNYIFYVWLLIFFQKWPYLWNSKLQSNSFFFCINSTRLSHNHMLETIIAFAWNSNLTLKNCLVKLGLSEKHTKFEKIILMLLMFTKYMSKAWGRLCKFLSASQKVRTLQKVVLFHKI